MRSSDAPAVSHAADPFQLLIDSHAGRTFYIKDAKTAAAINSGLSAPVFEAGRNYAVDSHANSLHTALGTVGVSTPAQAAALQAMTDSFKLSRDDVRASLTGRYAPEHTRETDARTLLDSSMLAGREEARGDGDALPRLQALSSNNLGEIRLDIAKLKEANPTLRDNPVINGVMGDVYRRYSEATATHATNNRVEGLISCTSDRIAIDRVASAATGDLSAAKKVSHTSAANTQHLQTHDMVFFNIYPKTNAQMQERQLADTRYLRVQPEVAGSPYSPDARSFSFPVATLVPGHDGLQVMTLRDPACPCGGTTAADAKRRLEQGGFATASAEQPPGEAVRYFGTTLDRYETQRNLFVGPADIQQALYLNVERGLLRTLDGLQKLQQSNPADDSALRFFAKIKQAHEAVGTAKDEQVMDLIKMYQYPQLMLAGSVPVRDAQVYRPSAQMIADSQPAARMAASSSAPPAASVRPTYDPNGRDLVLAALKPGKDGLAKGQQANMTLLADYIDTRAQERGSAISAVKLENKNLLKVSFANDTTLTIKSVEMSGIRETMKKQAQPDAPAASSSSPAPAQATSSASTAPASPATPGSDGGDREYKAPASGERDHKPAAAGYRM
ncbi:hypothetical protein J5226_19855 [Lysobacter sp. K5869]|uniref:hypothetical protein n=1 Tax=Lysobacter sp. K5869 TaxID=2820808 RepID=UPI001C06445C|nr:hypothetical protein [Lysobacter sp. K5869]QWP75840.1 hypothetical protein J5226_19855 [Lysobacter sp. K5869]